MAGSMHTNLKNVLLNMATATPSDNPFEMDGDGRGLMKFDAIRVEPTALGVRIVLSWRGRDLYVFDEQLSPGMAFTMPGLDGRMPFTLTGA